MDFFQVLKEYCEIPGPVGHEQRVQRAFIGDISQFTDEVEVTNVGNVLAYFPGEGPKLVVFGHADEICWYVLSITEEGFLRVSKHTGRSEKIPFPYTAAGQKALVVGDKGDVRGVFVAASGHVLHPGERDKPLESWDILVDIGASERSEVLDMGIHVGSPIIWNPETERLGDKVFGKAMDDRFTYPVMLELADRIQDAELDYDLYMASTVMEEFGLRGAESLSRHGFDVSIALDIGIAGDYPTLKSGRMPIKLGEGPVIVYKDGRIHYNLEVIHELRRVAEEHGIPYQHGIFEHYSSDSATMIAGGTRPGLLAPPCRYSHSPFEMMHLKDVKNTIELLYSYLTKEG
ncbi:MAG: M42 family metallopeptidase [Candidatus Bathyarchaeia archaeon]